MYNIYFIKYYNIEFSFSVVFDILIVIAEDVIFNLFILFLIFVVGTINVLVITMLAKFPQGRTVGFATPGVPITPILGIAINFYLMLRLSPLTLIRFTVWMVLGKNDSHTGCPNKFGIPFVSEASIVYKKICIMLQKIAYSAFFVNCKK